MSDKHPSGNPKLVKQHKEIQRKGDRELAEGASDPGHSAPERVPGKGKPDAEEGVGTVQQKKR
jgi:hypothetical protein